MLVKNTTLTLLRELLEYFRLSTYEVGGDPFSTGTGTTQNFSNFVTQTLGINSVPVGASTATGNSNIQTSEDGSVTVGVSSSTTTIGVGSASADLSASSTSEVI